MTPEAISATASSIAAFAAIVGVILAGIGLNTWRAQLTGTAEYDIARRLLLQVYRLKFSIEYVRQPGMTSRELKVVKEGIPWEVLVYEKRMEKVRAAINELETLTLEAKVILGKEKVEDLKNELRLHIWTLIHAIDAFSRAKMDKSFQEDYTNEHKQVLYAKEGDNYETKLDAIISKYEAYVEPHLKK